MRQRSYYALGVTAFMFVIFTGIAVVLLKQKAEDRHDFVRTASVFLCHGWDSSSM